MTRSTLRLASCIGLFVCACANAACSDGEKTPTSTTDTGAASDANTEDTSAADTAPVAPPETDITFDSKSSGPYFITGTVTLPAPIAAGRKVFFQLQWGGSIRVGGAGTTVAGSSFTYKVTNLEPGDYSIGASVDANGNDTLVESGDYTGFSGGTVAAPKGVADVVPVKVSTAPVTGADFGLGIEP